MLMVRNLEEDESGATVQFTGNRTGRLLANNPSHSRHLQLARNSLERGHPLGVCFGTAETIVDLLRAHNDVPEALVEQRSDCVQVHFMGHDGIFFLHGDSGEVRQLHALLEKAILRKAAVWFTAGRTLNILEAMPAGWEV